MVVGPIPRAVTARGMGRHDGICAQGPGLAADGTKAAGGGHASVVRDSQHLPGGQLAIRMSPPAAKLAIAGHDGM